MVMDLPASAESFLQTSVDGAIDPVPVIIGAALLVVAAVSANASSALLAYSPTKLRRLLGSDRGPAALELLHAHDLEIRVLVRLVMIASATGCLLLTSAGMEGTLGQILFACVCVAMAFLVAVLPAAVAQRGAERVVVLILPAIEPLRFILLYPLVRPLIRVCKPLLRALRIPDRPPTEPDEIADEILAAVDDSAGVGKLEEEERTWISNIVELKELHASEVMTPRTDIHALEASTPLFDAIKQAVAKGHSRLPVYEESIDNVVGVFYAKDILSRLAKEQDTSTITVGEVTRDPLFAPESMQVSVLLRDFKRTKVQMAIVLDEYGGTAGLITIEDVLEEIVGEITDEFDPEEEEPIKSIISSKVIEVSGKTRVEEANSALAAELVPQGEDYDTVGGYVFSHLGRIPESGETFQSAGLEYAILSVNNRRIGRVRLTLLTPLPADG